MTYTALSKDLYVLINQQDVEDTHLELVTKARMLADKLGGKVCCIIIGQSKEETANELANYGANSVYFLESPMFSKYCADSSGFYVEALSKLIESEKPRKIFCTDSLADRDLACRLAARMKAGLITGCVELSLGEDELMAYDKPAYLGRIINTLISHHTLPDIITVKAGVLEKAPCDVKRSPEVRVIKPELDSIKPPLKTLGIVKADPEQISLDEAGIIVTGGRGMGSAENFKLLDKLAGLLGGTVAGSLGAVDEGWVDRRKLVGQTGMTVEPKIYIACGVSGSIYHLMGMRDSKTIVAINRDRYAPIFKYADFGMVADAMKILPAIVDCLTKMAEKTANENKVSDA